MKKNFLLFSIGIFLSIYSSSYASAGSPSLVASIRDDAILSIVDIEQEVIIQDQNNTFGSIDDQNLDPTLEVYGVLERLNNNIPTTNATNTPSEISSHTDLEKFTKSLVIKNENLALVTVTSNSIAITRTVPTKLLWIFSVDGQETAKVTSWGDGTAVVQVTRPWWGTLSLYGTDKASVSDNLLLKMKNVPSALLTANLSANTKARIITDIESVFNEGVIDIKN